MIYQPKGSMCAACQHALRDCSGLPFRSMPVAKRINDVATSVICTDYQRKERDQ